MTDPGIRPLQGTLIRFSLAQALTSAEDGPAAALDRRLRPGDRVVGVLSLRTWPPMSQILTKPAGVRAAQVDLVALAVQSELDRLSCGASINVIDQGYRDLLSHSVAPFVRFGDQTTLLVMTDEIDGSWSVYDGRERVAEAAVFDTATGSNVGGRRRSPRSYYG